MEVIDDLGFKNTFKSNAPGVCIYFGERTTNFKNLDSLDLLLLESIITIPVVDDLQNFSSQIPKQLRGINGFQLKSELEIAALVSSVIEALSLLRLSRRLFISYRRKESRGVAIQLYENLDQCGFDVFLDTHSIRPGENFQDELWHRLVDTDVVVLLDTPDFLKSEWKTQVLAIASAMSIVILQLIWPNHMQESGSELCFPKFLKPLYFENQLYASDKAHLVDPVIREIASEVESLRARSLAARQDNLIKEFMVSARDFNIPAQLQPQRFITIDHNGKEISIIPTVGVPHAFTYHQSEELIKRLRKNNSSAFLVFDQRNIREKWQNHLEWLDQYLPVKTVKITDVDVWLKSI